MNKRFFTFVLILGLLLSGITYACPVCFSEKGGTLNAFRISTVFLSLLPLGFMGGLFGWVWYKYRKMDS